MLLESGKEHIQDLLLVTTCPFALFLLLLLILHLHEGGGVVAHKDSLYIARTPCYIHGMLHMHVEETYVVSMIRDRLVVCGDGLFQLL